MSLPAGLTSEQFQRMVEHRREQYRLYEEAVSRDSRPKDADGFTVGFMDFIRAVADLAGDALPERAQCFDAPMLSDSSMGPIVRSTQIGYMILLPGVRDPLGPYGNEDASKAVADIAARLQS